MPRRVRIPLALAVLSLLEERPMHPYEMQQLMRDRGQDLVIKLKGGSLYSTIKRLSESGLIEAIETAREGRRPERTVYALTSAGHDELMLWMEELLAEPTPDYPWFGAALAFVGLLPPEKVRFLLERRATWLLADIAAGEAVQRDMEKSGMPRLFGVESEYLLAMKRAELNWVRQLIADIDQGALVWPEEVIELQTTRAKEFET